MSIMDTLFAFTEWLRTTPLVNFAIWISNTKASLWIGNHFWATPIFQVIHIVAIAAAFGSVLMTNFRILGISGQGRTMTETVRRYLPWMWWAFFLLVLSGICMVTGEPVRNLINPFFWLKMGLIVAMVLASLGFQTSAHRNIARWEATHDGRAAVRIAAIVIILLWCGIIFCGRWIAYAPV